MDIVSWLPLLLGALGAALLTRLLVASNPSLRRVALRVSAAATLILFFQIDLATFVFQPHSYFIQPGPVYAATSAVYNAVESMTNTFSIIAWVLLLLAAARMRTRMRWQAHLFALTAVFTLASVLQILGSEAYASLYGPLAALANPPSFPHLALYLGLVHLAAPAALACAFLAPEDRAVRLTLEGASLPESPDRPANS